MITSQHVKPGAWAAHPSLTAGFETIWPKIVGFWPIWNDWRDLRQTYNGTVQNTVGFTSGERGIAGDFTAAGRVKVHSADIIAQEANSSVVVFLQTDAAARAGGYGAYVERSSATPLWKFDVMDDNISGNGFQLTHRDDSGSLSFIESATQVNDGVPHVIGLSKTGTDVRLFHDGAFQRTEALNGGDTITTTDSSIGGDANDTGARLDGLIYLVFVCNQALTDEEHRFIAENIYGLITPRADLSLAMLFHTAAAVAAFSRPLVGGNLAEAGGTIGGGLAR